MLVAGGVLVWFCFPTNEQEKQPLGAYHAEDTATRRSAVAVG